MSQAFAIDSSVLVALMNGEPEAAQFREAIDGAVRSIGWPTVFETRLWTTRRGLKTFETILESFISSHKTICVDFGREHEHLAKLAISRFGKGRHPAALNFGDCMTYAIAMRDDLPLLFKGNDFGQTDVRIHPASVILEQPR